MNPWYREKFGLTPSSASGAFAGMSNTTARTTATATSRYVLHIESNDVLLGRGTMIDRNEGNIRFRRLIQQFKLQYSACTRRQEKHNVAIQISQIINERNGRFLRTINTPQEMAELDIPIGLTAWALVDTDVVLAKIKQALRDSIFKEGSSEQQHEDDYDADLYQEEQHQSRTATESTVNLSESSSFLPSGINESNGERDTSLRPGSLLSLLFQKQAMSSQGPPTFPQARLVQQPQQVPHPEQQLTEKPRQSILDLAVQYLQGQQQDSLPSLPLREQGLLTSRTSEQGNFSALSSTLSTLQYIQNLQRKQEEQKQEQLENERRQKRSLIEALQAQQDFQALQRLLTRQSSSSNYELFRSNDVQNGLMLNQLSQSRVQASLVPEGSIQAGSMTALSLQDLGHLLSSASSSNERDLLMSQSLPRRAVHSLPVLPQVASNSPATIRRPPLSIPDYLLDLAFLQTAASQQQHHMQLQQKSILANTELSMQQNKDKANETSLSSPSNKNKKQRRRMYDEDQDRKLPPKKKPKDPPP